MKKKNKKKKQRKKEKINSTIHRIYRGHGLLDESIQNALSFANYLFIPSASVIIDIDP